MEAVEAVETPESVEMSGEIRPVTALSSRGSAALPAAGGLRRFRHRRPAMSEV